MASVGKYFIFNVMDLTILGEKIQPRYIYQNKHKRMIMKEGGTSLTINVSSCFLTLVFLPCLYHQMIAFFLTAFNTSLALLYKLEIASSVMFAAQPFYLSKLPRGTGIVPLL